VLRGTVRELSSRITDENRLAIQQVIKQYNHRIAKLKSEIGQYSPKDFQDLQVQTMEWEQDYMEERLSRIEEAQDQLEERLRNEDAGIEQAPASTQSATGDETEAETSTEAETVADRDADAQLIDRRGDDQDELLNLRSQEQAARRILSTISGSLFHLDRGGELRWRAYTARRRLRGLLHSQFHRLKHLTQPIDKDRVYVAGRHLQAEMNHFLIEKLYSELGKGRFKTEDLLNTIINHQMIESSAEGKTEYAGIPAVRDQVEEAKREGYAIELSQIQDMVESGEISRTTARKMRRNVYVMQVDADSAL
ncbi:MAG: sodium:proton antiporter, partial [Bifidobacteriales bacterium]|nr:sodium:proton antiporter [Bifidobacteriales bacterium]